MNKQHLKVNKYKKKPVTVEAIKLDAEKNMRECYKFIGRACAFGCATDGTFINIETLEGVMQVRNGDYIIKGVQGEFYPCKPEIFIKTHEEVKS